MLKTNLATFLITLNVSSDIIDEKEFDDKHSNKRKSCLLFLNHKDPLH